MVKSIGWSEVDNYLAEQYILVGLREEYETAQGIVDNAIVVPMSQLRLDFSTLDQHQSYLFYCQSGRRSQVMVKSLIQDGFDSNQVINISGGYNEWQKWHNLKK